MENLRTIPTNISTKELAEAFNKIDVEKSFKVAFLNLIKMIENQYGKPLTSVNDKARYSELKNLSMFNVYSFSSAILILEAFKVTEKSNPVKYLIKVTSVDSQEPINFIIKS